MTRLRKRMLEELQRRDYSHSTVLTVLDSNQPRWVRPPKDALCSPASPNR
jgi:hypothetical protein